MFRRKPIVASAISFIFRRRPLLEKFSVLVQIFCFVLVPSAAYVLVLIDPRNLAKDIPSAISQIDTPYEALFILSFSVLFILVTLFATCALFLPAIHNVNLIRKIREDRISVGELFFCYIETLLSFSILYFLLGYFCETCAINGVYELKTVDFYQKNDDKFYINLFDYFMLMLDYFHFSVVTQTTLGYGDMLPTHLVAKLLVDLQALIGIYFIGIAIASKVSAASGRN